MQSHRPTVGHPYSQARRCDEFAQKLQHIPVGRRAARERHDADLVVKPGIAHRRCFGMNGRGERLPCKFEIHAGIERAGGTLNYGADMILRDRRFGEVPGPWEQSP